MKLPSIKGVQFNLVNALWLVLLLVLVLDFFAVKRAYGILDKARTEDLGIQATRFVRVNFESYNSALKRIDGWATFTPQDVTERNPFLSMPRKGE